MTALPVVPRALAEQDVDDALQFYVAEAGATVALGFVDALERAYRLLAEQPNAGATRYAHELGLPGLRHWPLQGYPYVVFYVAGEDRVDVWRVLHAARDIPAWIAQPA